MAVLACAVVSSQLRGPPSDPELGLLSLQCFRCYPHVPVGLLQVKPLRTMPVGGLVALNRPYV